MTTIRNPQPHPVADLFPLLPDEELAELAASIKEQGLLSPIVLDADGLVLDGRNRLAACKLAGVEPTFTTYEGDSPETYALTVNIARRQLTKGQMAMVAAVGCKQSLQSTSTRKLGKALGVSGQRITQANVVQDNVPTLVPLVISGSMSLNEAYTEAKRVKEAAESLDTKVERIRDSHPDIADAVAEDRMTLEQAEAAVVVANRVEELRPDYPDLADQVASGSLTIDEAQAAANARAAEMDRRRLLAVEFLSPIKALALTGLTKDIPATAGEYATLAPHAVTDEELGDAIQFLTHLRKARNARN